MAAAIAGVVLPAAVAGQAPAPAVLQVTLLGTGNPRPTAERFGPSILVEAGAQAILVDAGRGSTQRLFEIGQRALLTRLDAVVLTHLHSDHTVGLPDLVLTPWIFGRTTPLRLLGPPGTVDMARHLEAAYAYDRVTRAKDEGFPAAGATFDADDVSPGIVYDADGLRVTAFAVDHGAFATPAYGYRVDYRGRSAAFSGDTRFHEPLAVAAKGVDVLVHEVISPEVEMRRAQVQGTAALERIVARHASPEQVGTIFARVQPKLAVYSHIVPSPATAEDLVAPTRRTYAGPLAVGYDLMTIVITDTVEVFPRRTLSDK
ncbi:MAG: MBL fold metallo-hydrolase [Vicinamibacterales bacterium]